jgi:hypothetical protein
MHGTKKSPTWTMLDITAEKDTNTFITIQEVNWVVGD